MNLKKLLASSLLVACSFGSLGVASYANVNAGNGYFVAKKQNECLYKRESNGYCSVGFYSHCYFSLGFGFCHQKRVKAAKENCASGKLDPEKGAGLIGGCYFGGPTCYCATE